MQEDHKRPNRPERRNANNPPCPLLNEVIHEASPLEAADSGVRDQPIPSPPLEDETLYVLPDECVEQAEGAVRAGLARTAQEYWTYMVGPRAPSEDEGATVLELLVAGIIRANSASRNDPDSVEDRFRVAMRALLGTSHLDGDNGVDDRALLSELAWLKKCRDLPDSEVRGAAREALTSLRGKAAVTESAVRRITKKYRDNPDRADSLAYGVEFLRLLLEGPVLLKIAALLRSTGIAVKLPGTPNGHLDLSMEK